MHIDWSQRKHASLLLDFWTAMVNHPVVECLARTIPLNHSSMGDAPKAETVYSEKEISLIFLLWRCPLTWGFQFSVLIELPPPPNLKICSYNTAKNLVPGIQEKSKFSHGLWYQRYFPDTVETIRSSDTLDLWHVFTGFFQKWHDIGIPLVWIQRTLFLILRDLRYLQISRTCHPFKIWKCSRYRITIMISFGIFGELITQIFNCTDTQIPFVLIGVISQ